MEREHPLRRLTMVCLGVMAVKRDQPVTRRMSVCLILLALAAGMLAANGVRAESISCSFCGSRIEGTYYKLSDGRVICSDCRGTLSRCDACGAPFKRGRTENGTSFCASCLRSADRCGICGDIITGRYWKTEASGTAYCDRCWNEVPRCSLCNGPATSHMKLHGYTVCPECVDRLPPCMHCHDPIVSSYYSIEGEKLCEFCYDELLKCDVCGTPLVGAFKKVGDHRACITCYRKIPECAACDERIIGNCWYFEDNDNTYCDRCRNNKHRCRVCGLPLDRGSRLLADGRDVCSQCFRTGISDLGTTRTYLVGVKHLLHDLLDMRVETPTGLSLVSRDKMLDLSRKSPHLEKNRKDEFLGLFVREGDDFHVYVEYGLTPPVLIGTLAHEYTHVWQETNCPREQSLILREGFAEWVRYKVLERKGYTHEMKHLDRRTDLYGQGFQLLRRIEKERGVDGLFEYITSATGVEEAETVRRSK